MKARNLIFAAAFAACPIFAGSSAFADDAGTPMAGAAMQQPVATPMAPATKDVQEELGKVVDAATSSDPLASVINNTSKADRDRLGVEPAIDSTDLTKAVDQFRKDWQAKYGQDFMAGDKASIIFSDQHVKIMQGNTASAMMMPGDRTVNPNTGEMTTGNGSETAKGAVAAAQNTSGNGNMLRGGDIKTDAAKNDADRVDSLGRPVEETHGKDTAGARQLGEQIGNGTGGSPAAILTPDSLAMVMIPGHHGQKSATLNLVNDGANAGWKVKLISHATSQDVHDSLLKQVNAIEGMKANWPSDVNEAYVAASRHLLTGLSDAGMQMGM